MDDEVEMDASGCWVMKNSRVISETPLSSHSEHYNRLAYSLDAIDAVDNDKRDEF
jgi:hypothetical protein